jgi:hypothetical protein
MLKVVADEATREDLAASPDETVREGAADASRPLKDEVAAYLAAHAAEATRTGGLWSATGTPGPGRSPRRRARWR